MAGKLQTRTFRLRPSSFSILFPASVEEVVLTDLNQDVFPPSPVLLKIAKPTELNARSRTLHPDDDDLLFLSENITPYATAAANESSNVNPELVQDGAAGKLSILIPQWTGYFGTAPSYK